MPTPKMYKQANEITSAFVDRSSHPYGIVPERCFLTVL